MNKQLPFISPAHASKHLRLSEKYPSGLEWSCDRGQRKAGDMAGKWNDQKRFYLVRVLGEQLCAHRIVYYLRNHEDPADHDVIHALDNVERDNRKELYLVKRSKRKTYRKN